MTIEKQTAPAYEGEFDERDPIDRAIAAFHDVHALAGNEPFDWPANFLDGLRTAMKAALAVASQPVERVHPDLTDSTLNATLPTWPELNTLMRSLYSASFDYGYESGKPVRNPHYLRVQHAQGRLRYALHVILGTEPADENELAQINGARCADGRIEIKLKSGANLG